MWPLPAPGQVFSVGVGLSFVLLCRLSRVPCPLFCLELTSLWQLPLSFLDSHQDSFCSVFTGSDICWSSQVVCGDPSGVFPWLRVLPHVRALSRFWFNVSRSLRPSPVVTGALLIFARRFSRFRSSSVLPSSVYAAMDAVANLPPDVFLGLIGFAFACVNVCLLCLMVSVFWLPFEVSLR